MKYIKRINLLISVLLLTIGIITFPSDILIKTVKNKTENIETNIVLKKLNSKNTKEKESKYEYILFIPKIDLKRPLYENKKENDINKNIKILKNYSNFIVLAAHSGTSEISYFKRIKELTKEDVIYFYKGNKKHIYRVVKKYTLKKTGKIKVDYLTNNKVLVLTTCYDKKRQLIIVSEEVNN